MRTVFASAMCAVLLSGCASLMFEEHDPQKLYAQDVSACRQYGYRQNTDVFAQCMQLRDQGRQAHDDAARARVSAGLSSIGRQLAAPPPRMTTCTTTGSAFGSYGSVSGHSTTTCF